MSYARWGNGGSDVYVFTAKDNDGKYVIECCGCVPEKFETPYTDFFGITHEYNFVSFYAKTREEMDAHLLEHRTSGHIVCDDTFERLAFDYPDARKPIDDYEREANV